MFVLQRVTPVDPVRAKLGSNASKSAVAAERKRLGYDKPLLVQYVDYLGDLAQGNLQESLRTRRPVMEDIGDYLPATAELAVYGLVFAVVLGAVLGLASAARFRGSGVLRARLDVIWDAFQHLLMPAFCVAIGPAVSIGRVLRGSLVGNLRSDYVRTARAKGLRERTVLLRHALRNSAGPALSMTGLQVGLMFAGVVVVETIFAWGGLGQY